MLPVSVVKSKQCLLFADVKRRERSVVRYAFGVQRKYKRKKVLCRNSRPLTIACHMKKNVKSKLSVERSSCSFFFSFLYRSVDETKVIHA
jgi:hypothetical protein